MKFVLRLFVILALGIGGSVTYMVSNESDYIFFPERDMVQSPSTVGLRFSGRRFQSADGVMLYGWYMPQPKAHFLLLSLHGNAGNISHRLDQYRRWHDMGLAVFAFDYRGYGGSGGTPSEAGLYADAKGAWNFLTRSLGVPPGRIILSGRSLGCAVAAELAGEVKPAGLALEVPFTSIPDMSADHYPWLPLRWFIRNRFDTQAALARVQVPLLMISARSDEIVPGWMAQRLFTTYAGNKLRGALKGGHNDFDSVSERLYIRLWEIWLDSLGQPEDSPQQWVQSLPKNEA